MLIKTSELSKGEKLLVYRRRRGLTQSKSAKERKVSLYTYRRWEADELDAVPKVSVGRLSEAEQCFLLRKRKGMSLADAAKEIDICRWWLCQMESGEAPIDRLLAYWYK